MSAVHPSTVPLVIVGHTVHTFVDGIVIAAAALVSLPLGVTAAFNKNLLVRANRELGADFDLDGFAHRAVWNGEMSRIEMHLVSNRRQQVRVPAAALEITFETGETIWTESSYKYLPNDVVRMLDRAGFSTLEQWAIDGFALTLAGAG